MSWLPDLVQVLDSNSYWKRSERRADFLGAPMDPEKTYMDCEVTATGKLQQVGGASPT